MLSPLFARPLVPLSFLLACAVGARSIAPAPPQDDAQAAFASLVEASHWRVRNAARDRLIELGDEALQTVLTGTRHESDDVRAICHEILRGQYATDPRAIEVFVRGLDDSNRGYVAYPAAFHLGEHKIEAGRAGLRICLAAEETDRRTRYAASKSLGELGEKEVMVTLWRGLGSEDPYTRYLSNLGAKGLTGKDLTDFDYEGPWEIESNLGGFVRYVQGHPILKARWRVQRWQAVLDFTQWLKGEHPVLFAELEEKLW
ncbi:MAG: hypothetical protein V3T22_03485 [Planctomycetota bacterium]